MLALVAEMLVGLSAMAIAHRWSRVSFHVGIAAGACTVLCQIYGVAARPPVLLVVAVIAWARLRSGHHTLGQAFAGAILGVAAGALFAVL